MKKLGTHIIAELYGSDFDILNSRTKIRDILVNAAEKAGANILSDSFHVFEPQGVTGIVCLAESHISIHTWPEFLYAAVDVFTCGNTVDPIDILDNISDELGCSAGDTKVIERGIHHG